MDGQIDKVTNLRTENASQPNLVANSKRTNTRSCFLYFIPLLMLFSKALSLHPVLLQTKALCVLKHLCLVFTCLRTKVDVKPAFKKAKLSVKVHSCHFHKICAYSAVCRGPAKRKRSQISCLLLLFNPIYALTWSVQLPVSLSVFMSVSLLQCFSTFQSASIRILLFSIPHHIFCPDSCQKATRVIILI